MGKKAVVIGCNYPGTDGELHGCINDATNVQNCLIERFGFTYDDMKALIDTDPSFTQSTGKNITDALEWLVGSASPGDFLFVYYSGHGTRLPADVSDQLDATGYDECIVPTDMNLISDGYFKELVSLVPDGCRLTIVSDSCRSGGLVEGVKEQIGDSTKGDREDEDGTQETIQEEQNEADDDDGTLETIQEEQNVNQKAKFLSISTLVNMLKRKTGKDDIDAEKLRPTLSEIHGEDFSPAVKKFANRMVSKLKPTDEREGHGAGGFMSLVETLMKQKLDETEEQLPKPELQTEETYIPGNGILLSGCQSYQLSMDARPEGEEPRGVFTNALLTVLAESQGSVSNYELVTKAAKILESQGYAQRPGLYCSDEHAQASFVC